MRSILRWVVLGGFALFTSAAAAKTLLGELPSANDGGEQTNFWVEFGAITVFGLVLQIGAQLAFLQPRGVARLKEGTKGFADYFSEWYARPGKLRLLTRDLDWLEETQNLKIRTALERKAQAGSLTVYLIDGADTRGVATLLKNQGATILEVKTPDLHYEYRISVARDQDECSMIVRTKTQRSTANKKISTVRESVGGPYPTLAERFLDTIETTEWVANGKSPLPGYPTTE